MTNEPTPSDGQAKPDGFSSFDPASLPSRPAESFPDPDDWVFDEAASDAPSSVERVEGDAGEATQPARQGTHQPPPPPAPPQTPPVTPAAPPPVMPHPMTPAPPGVPHRQDGGAAAPMHQPHHQTVQRPHGQTSGLAAGSLVLGILGFLSCGLTGLVGMVMGIVAMVSIGRSNGRIRGQGMAITGLVLSVISLTSVLFYSVIAAIVLPQFSMAAEEAMFSQSVARMQYLVSNTELYEVVHDDRLPPANNWVNAMELDGAFLAHPDDPTGVRRFAMNISLDRHDRSQLADAANTVLFFESRANGPLAGGRELLPNQPRYFDGYLVIYANGDLGVIPAHELATVIWEP